MKNASVWARPRSSKSWSSEAGQGTLEYVLVLVVSVLIILGVLYQFNDAFKTYVTGYFGDYVSCLLEVGDLPGVASECAMPNFDLKNGKKLITSIDGKGGGSSSSGSSTSSSNTSQSSGDKGAGKSAASSSSSGGGGSTASETASGSGPNRFASGGGGRQRSVAAGSIGDGAGARGTQDDVLGISPTSTSVGRYNGGDRSRANNMAWGYYDTDEARQKEDDKASITASSRSVSQNSELKAKSAKFETSRKAASVDSDDDSGFSFGSMLRILLIVLMIVAIVVFFGGQILQIAKSGDE